MELTSPDFLIVGGGIAGLRAAIALAPVGRVLILTKDDPAESNTGYAQGGIAAAIGPGDSPTLHGEDTVRAGDGLCEEDAVRVLVEEGPGLVRELMTWGAEFDRGFDGRPALGLEAAHSVRRILHAGDATGREIGRILWEQVAPMPSVQTIDHALVTDLVVDEEGVSGVRYFDRSGRRDTLLAGATLLATGGAGQVFRETTNPAVATGDGIALAYHAGARVADLEFVQFHPTALGPPGSPRFLISEAVRGEGARLVNVRGELFMPRYHSDGDLAPRDVVARSIALEAERTGGPVCLTLAHLDPLLVRQRFPTIAAMCRRHGLDLATDPIPVGPAAHYLMGGIATDAWGRTSVPRLFAAGETACTGLHGANRLASNSLLEGLVFGARAALAMQQAPRSAALGPSWVEVEDRPPDASASGPGPTGRLVDAAGIRDLMWRSAGLFRSGPALAGVVETLDRAYARAVHAGHDRSPADWRDLNLKTVARLIALAALRRSESRGGHFRSDFPARDDLHWKVHFVNRRAPLQ